MKFYGLLFCLLLLSVSIADDQEDVKVFFEFAGIYSESLAFNTSNQIQISIELDRFQQLENIEFQVFACDMSTGLDIPGDKIVIKQNQRNFTITIISHNDNMAVGYQIMNKNTDDFYSTHIYMNSQSVEIVRQIDSFVCTEIMKNVKVPNPK